MGGKKPIGEHPSRGHLQRRFTSIARRGAHTHRGYFDYGSKFDENESMVVPVIQEFSLFSEFDISPDRFGILSKEIDKENLYSKEEKLETVTVPPFKSGIVDNIFGPKALSKEEEEEEEEEEEGEEEYGPSTGNQVEALQMTVFHLSNALERLEYQFYAAMNNIYCFGVPVPLPTATEGVSVTTTTAQHSSPSVTPDESTSALLKRVNERLSTLEGRQKTIQSKISQLDNLYGQSTQAWGKSIREILKANVSTEPSEGKEDNGPPSPVAAVATVVSLPTTPLVNRTRDPLLREESSVPVSSPCGGAMEEETRSRDSLQSMSKDEPNLPLPRPLGDPPPPLSGTPKAQKKAPPKTALDPSTHS
jgi:hypothetical protein